MARPRKIFVNQQGSGVLPDDLPEKAQENGQDEAPKQRLLKSLINGRTFAWCPELAKRSDMVEI